MLREIVKRWNRVYNHGRKVGLGTLTLDCGHEVSYQHSRKPEVGEKAWCSRCAAKEAMSRYSELAKKLQSGETVTYREHGSSMLPKLKNNVLVTVIPCKLQDLQVGDIAFCKVGGSYFLHYVKAIGQDGRVQIGNAHGHINGWTRSVFGKLGAFENP